MRVSLPIYAEATAVLRTASAAGRPGDELPAEVRADAAYVTGHPVMTTPASIQVAAHEAAIIVRRLAPGQLEALHAVGHD
ncbi:hypothetical protein BCD48_20365 [Pseudofrankia sp. BMG5.36]|nr:hypothetical protein BCD48_20365 [Pseudofrankia sp. BMG5.36]